MTNAITPALTTSSLIPTDHEMIVYDTMAKQAAESKLYRTIGDVFAIKMIMLRARELNVAPMTALDGGIHIINGRTEISARLMGAMIFRAGHSITTIKTDSTECVLKGTRSDGSSQTASFTIEEAKQAGLIKDGGGWKKYPQDMLYARALSRLARRIFPDVIGTGYVEGEIKEKPIHPMDQSQDIVLEVEEESDEELLKNFLSKFDKDEARGWADYIHQLRQKLNLTIRQIVNKYESSPEEATKNFQTWMEKNNANTNMEKLCH